MEYAHYIWATITEKRKHGSLNPYGAGVSNLFVLCVPFDTSVPFFIFLIVKFAISALLNVIIINQQYKQNAFPYTCSFEKCSFTSGHDNNDRLPLQSRV